MSALWFPFQRHTVLQKFLRESQAKKTVDPQSFWQFREFYSPGHFEFSKTGFKKDALEAARTTIDMPIQKDIGTPFLVYHSPYLGSIDSLVTDHSLHTLVDEKELKNIHILLKTDTTLIYEDSDNSVKMIFIKPLSEMEKANGFFDYKGSDMNIVNGKYWLNMTAIQEK